jgi:hypothetical protein
MAWRLFRLAPARLWPKSVAVMKGGLRRGMALAQKPIIIIIVAFNVCIIIESCIVIDLLTIVVNCCTNDTLPDYR